MVKNYIFLGAPGVGKGTIAKLLAQREGFIHISTGDMFRNHIKEQTPIGLKVKSILDSGDFVPDELTNELVKLTLEKHIKNNIILDGYPRTINQAKFLKEINFKLTAAVLLDAPDDIVQSRLEFRAKKENRADDTKEVIANRIKIYKEKTQPLINFYQKDNLLIVIDSKGNIEENYEQLIRGLK